MAKNSQMNDEKETFTTKDLTHQVKLCFKLYLEVPKLKEAEDVDSLDFPDHELTISF